MPKIKKIRSAALAAQTERHEPLGQVLQDDENRHKYASAASVRKHFKNRGGGNNDDNDGSEFLDEKTSARILELSKQQQAELDAEEELQRHKQRGLEKSNSEMVVPDSDDEDDAQDEFEDEEYEWVIDWYTIFSFFLF